MYNLLKQLVRKLKNKSRSIVIKMLVSYEYMLDNVSKSLLIQNSSSLSLRHKSTLHFWLDAQRYISSALIEAEGIYRCKFLLDCDPKSLSALITMEYHRIEKGLALPNRRAGASQDVVQRLIFAIKQQLESGAPSFEGAIGLRTLQQYFEETPTSALSKETLELMAIYANIKEEYNKVKCYSNYGGYEEINKENLLQYCGKTQVNFLTSRHSIRDFEQKPIDTTTIIEVVDIAKKAPSVCNRQSWHTYAIRDRELILEALAFQNGNRGFAERIPLLFVVTSDLRTFVSLEERNQGWIDGGLFSMMLSLALYAKGIGSCMLNWCATDINDKSLRELLKIPKYEIIIMMMAAGYLPEKVRVTASPRRATRNVVTFL